MFRKAKMKTWKTWIVQKIKEWVISRGNYFIPGTVFLIINLPLFLHSLNLNSSLSILMNL